jgi:hypothetical protein
MKSMAEHTTEVPCPRCTFTLRHTCRCPQPKPRGPSKGIQEERRGRRPACSNAGTPSHRTIHAHAESRVSERRQIIRRKTHARGVHLRSDTRVGTNSPEPRGPSNVCLTAVYGFFQMGHICVQRNKMKLMKLNKADGRHTPCVLCEGVAMPYATGTPCLRVPYPRGEQHGAGGEPVGEEPLALVS